MGNYHIGFPEIRVTIWGVRVKGLGFEGFLKLGVPFWGVPLVRTIVLGGLYWGPLI